MSPTFKKLGPHHQSNVTAGFLARCGNFFHQKRIQSKKTEEETSDYLGVSLPVLQSYESGKVAIPLNNMHALSFFLNIDPVEIAMLIMDSGEETTRPTPFFENDLLGVGDIGKIIQSARETVALSINEIVELLNSNFKITEQEFLNLEKNEDVPSVSFWIGFCDQIHLAFDSVHGYSRLDHLMRIYSAIKSNEIKIPVKPELTKSRKESQRAFEEHLTKWNVHYLVQCQKE